MCRKRVSKIEIMYGIISRNIESKHVSVGTLFQNGGELAFE